MSKRIVISGYYGFGNTGDEAVLAGILATFERIAMDARVTVLSGDPERTMAEHPGVDSVHRMRPGEVLRAIRGADLVISGGGSLLQDVTSAHSAHYYLSILWLAKLLRRKTMVYAQGVGPLVRASTRKAVARTLSGVDVITVRDQDSKSLLEVVGVSRVPIEVAGDPAFLVKPDYESADRILSESGLSGAAIVGVSLRSWGTGDLMSRIAEGISRASLRPNVRIALIPMQAPQDVEASSAVTSATLLPVSPDPRVMKGLIGRCGMVVGMRLHSLIFAASECVPFVPIVYDPKVSSFARLAGQDPGVDVESLTADALSDAMQRCWAQREQLRDHLSAKNEQFTDMALRSGELARKLIGA